MAHSLSEYSLSDVEPNLNNRAFETLNFSEIKNYITIGRHGVVLPKIMCGYCSYYYSYDDMRNVEDNGVIICKYCLQKYRQILDNFNVCEKCGRFNEHKTKVCDYCITHGIDKAERILHNYRKCKRCKNGVIHPDSKLNICDECYARNGLLEY